MNEQQYIGKEISTKPGFFAVFVNDSEYLSATICRSLGHVQNLAGRLNRGEL